MPGAVLSTAIVTAAWGLLVYTGSIDTIWPMFGIANQLLAVVALALVTTWLVNTGRGRYALITILPMLFVTATTLTAATEMVTIRFPKMISSENPGLVIKGLVSLPTTIFVVACVLTLLLLAVSRWIAVFGGMVPVRSDVEPPAWEDSAAAEAGPGLAVPPRRYSHQGGSCPMTETLAVTEPAKPWLEITSSPHFAAWLREQRVSLAFTTYQTGKLFLLGAKPDGQLAIFERTFNRCMGLWADGQSLWLSSLYQLWRFENTLRPGESYQGHDALLCVHSHRLHDRRPRCSRHRR